LISLTVNIFEKQQQHGINIITTAIKLLGLQYSVQNAH